MSKCLKCGEFVNASKTGVRFLGEVGPYHPECAREVKHAAEKRATEVVEERRAEIARSTRGAAPIATDRNPGEGNGGPS